MLGSCQWLFTCQKWFGYTHPLFSFTHHAHGAKGVETQNSSYNEIFVEKVCPNFEQWLDSPWVIRTCSAWLFETILYFSERFKLLHRTFGIIWWNIWCRLQADVAMQTEKTRTDKETLPVKWVLSLVAFAWQMLFNYVQILVLCFLTDFYESFPYCVDLVIETVL